ncbi:MAG: glycosyltransferase family 39 protein [Anaerolineae bacterium]|nr:MAG: glycosyltransferase family 39 protein [Anaerolineae bacterium]
MKTYERLTWLAIGFWFLFCLATLNYNGPFFDEGIYVTAGQRTLEGHGTTDGYIGWFVGSLLWPVLAAVGYKVAGLVGTRAVALTFATVAFVAITRATKNLFGQKASFWATVAFAASGPFLTVARLGVYDSAALASMATSFWAITELERRDNRIWLGIAAIAFTVGVFAKYPTGLMLLPLWGLVLVLRGEKALTDIAVFGFIGLAMALAFLLPVRGQLLSFLHWRSVNQPDFGVTLSMIGLDILYLSAAPSLLALSGWFVARGKRGLASVLLLSLAIWPAYHLLSGDPVSRNKHLVLGFLFAYPLVGLALSALWGTEKPGRAARQSVAILAILTLAAIGLVQLNQSNRAWPDARQAADYLLDRVQPGQRLLINESWPYTMYLYAEGRIDSPWDVFDVYRIAHGQSEIGLCEYDWFVDSRGSYAWPGPILEAIERCGNFRQAFSTTSTVVGLGTDLNHVSYPVSIAVWQNTGRR